MRSFLLTLLLCSALAMPTLAKSPKSSGETKPPNHGACVSVPRGSACQRDDGSEGSCQPSMCTRKVMFGKLERVEGFPCLECQRPLTDAEKEAMKPPAPPTPEPPPAPVAATPYAPERAASSCGGCAAGEAAPLALFSMLALSTRRRRLL
jgi:hypothetical protein